jgi:hypothetical protein
MRRTIHCNGLLLGLSLLKQDFVARNDGAFTRSELVSAEIQGIQFVEFVLNELEIVWRQSLQCGKNFVYRHALRIRMTARNREDYLFAINRAMRSTAISSWLMPVA